MSPTLRWSLLVAGEASLLLFLLVFGNALIGFVPLHRLQLVILAVLGGIGWVVILARPRVLPPLLVAAPLPILASLAITSVMSPYPSLSGYATWQSAAYVGIAWLLAIQASHPVGRRNLVAVMGIVVSIVIVAYLGHVLSSWLDWLALGFPLTSVPLRPLYSGGLLLIPAWLADVVVLSSPTVVVSLWLGRHRVPAVVLAVVTVVAIVLSGTRAVVLLLAVVAAMAVIGVILSRGDRRTKVLLGTTLVAVATVGISVVIYGGRGFDAGRTSFIASAVDRFVESPLLGTGPGTYGVGRMSDPVDSLFRLAESDALNVVLTTASDSGVVGLVGLGLAAAAYILSSRRAWSSTPSGRPVILAAGLGIAVFAGHAMGEFVFGLIGVILLLIANVSIAVTDARPGRTSEPRPSWLTASLVAGVVIIATSSVVVVRNEMTLTHIEAADGAVTTSPGAALDEARAATEASPDSVPAWWIRMVAADAAGDLTEALAAAHMIVDLEGFGQEWLSLGVLRARSGDAAGAREAFDRATAFPALDPVVELNAALHYHTSGDSDDTTRALVRLLQVQPDIEPLLADTVPQLASPTAAARREAAIAALGWDVNTAFLIALSGEDRDLATELLGRVAATDPASEASWRTIIAAWFGDDAARATHDSLTLAQPTLGPLDWSWRLAARACDDAAADRWARAIEIGTTVKATMPVVMGVTPTFHSGMFPPRYPVVVWRVDHPQRAYVDGIWTFNVGRAPCTGP